jgi:hypothetical protein
MSDGLQLQSIELPDIADLQTATVADAAVHIEPPPAANNSSDSDWSARPAKSSFRRFR